MSYIRIIACPPGEAPLAVREAWIGLELPLSSNPLVGPGRRSFFTGGVISGPRGWWQTLVQLVRGQLARPSGYAVNASTLSTLSLLRMKPPHSGGGLTVPTFLTEGEILSSRLTPARSASG